MSRLLSSNEEEDKNNKIAKAIDYLHSAADAFEKSGLKKEAREVDKILYSIAQNTPNNSTKSSTYEKRKQKFDSLVNYPQLLDGVNIDHFKEEFGEEDDWFTNKQGRLTFINFNKETNELIKKRNNSVKPDYDKWDPLYGLKSLLPSNSNTSNNATLNDKGTYQNANDVENHGLNDDEMDEINRALESAYLTNPGLSKFRGHLMIGRDWYGTDTLFIRDTVSDNNAAELRKTLGRIVFSPMTDKKFTTKFDASIPFKANF